MSVFPSARRTLAHPSRLPWFVAAVALIAATLAVPAYTALHESARNLSSPLAADTSSVSTASLRPIDAEADGSPSFRAAAQQDEYLDDLTATDAVLATLDGSLVAIPASDAASEAVVGYLSEVSSTSTVAREAEDVATAATQAAASESAAAVAVPGGQTAAAVPPPAQPVAQTFATPVQRWAASGIYIETAGQSLDDASLANVDAALSALPPSLLGRLGNPAFGSLHILVNKEGRVLSGDQPYDGPANFFSTNEGTNELVLYPAQSVFTIVHELGHAYNLRNVGAGRYAMVLLDPEMRSFLAATGWKINSSDVEIRGAVDHMHVSYSYSGGFHWSGLSNDDPLEDFANTFAAYFLAPDSLRQDSPERYEWMLSTFGR